MIKTGVREGAGAVVVTVVGELDLTAGPSLRDALEQAASSGTSALVVDLSRVRFFGAAGLHCLELVTTVMQRRGGAVHLVFPQDGPVASVLAALGLHRRWPVHPDVPMALRVAAASRGPAALLDAGVKDRASPPRRSST